MKKKTDKKELKIKLIKYLLILISLCLISLSFAWFTDKKSMSSEIDFGEIKLIVDDATEIDKSSTELFLKVFRDGAALPIGSKVMPGDTLKTTVRITNNGTEDMYYIMNLSADNDVVNKMFNGDFYKKNDSTYKVKNVLGDNMFYTLIDEEDLEVYERNNLNVETLINNGDILGELNSTNNNEVTIEISQKIDEELEQGALLSSRIKVNCNVYAIQKANLNSFNAYKQLMKLKNKDALSDLCLLDGKTQLENLNVEISDLQNSIIPSSLCYISFTNYNMFAGKTITKIEVPVKSVSAINSNQVYTIRHVKYVNNSCELIKEYSLKVPYNQISGCTASAVNKWITFEDLNIEIGEDENLYFGKSTDNVMSGFIGLNVQNQNSLYYFSSRANDSITAFSQLTQFNASFPLRIFCKNKLDTSQFNDKNLSILGDSISTFWGYVTQQNSTTSSNEAFYSTNKLTSVDETYWMRVINTLDMNFCVNNSWSGTTASGLGLHDQDGVAGGYNRANQLHDDTTSNNPNNEVINPNVILLNMGLNDCALSLPCGTVSSSLITTVQNAVDADNFTATNFAEAYIAMVYKMKKAYPNVSIYCLNIPFRNATTDSNLTSFNNVIEEVCNAYTKTYLVDIFDTPMYGTDYAQFTVPNATSDHDNIHPNAQGMKIMANEIINTMLKYGV